MKITLKNFTIMASVGIHDYEKINKTKILISCDVILKNYSIKDILDYDQIIKIIQEVTQKKHYCYIEEIADVLCEEIKTLNINVEKITTKVQKCIFGNMLEELSVEIEK